MAKQNNSPKVDEDFMKELISQGFPMKKEKPITVPQPEVEPEVQPTVQEQEPKLQTSKPREPKRRKEQQEESFVELFFEKVDFSNRQMTTITRETHQKLTDIVNSLGGKNATIGSYIENIIRKHFENYKDEINALYATQFKSPLE